MFQNVKRYPIRINILMTVWVFVLNIFCLAVHQKKKGILYILMWTNSTTDPFNSWLLGRKSLKIMNCEFQNCYLTHDVKYLRDPMDYDVILFNAPNIDSDMVMPLSRSHKQIYVFVSTESESNFPISERFGYYFNYTWSYKLNSDIPYPYFYVRNKLNGKVIAPQTSVQWRNHNDMKPTPKSVVKHLNNKSICAAWFVSNCHANNKRLVFAQSLRSQLYGYDQSVDIFGDCDPNKYCPRDTMDECFQLVKTDYYFYLAFENSFDEDYVTDKVLTALNNYAVPVVFGGANYSRFLPDGAYINAKEYSPEMLAFKMNYIVNNKQEYYDYFKHSRYYTYHTKGESEDIDPLCTFCKFINNNTIWTQRRVFPMFSSWWNNNDIIVESHTMR